VSRNKEYKEWKWSNRQHWFHKNLPITVLQIDKNKEWTCVRITGWNWCCAVSGKWAKFTAVKLFSLTGSKVKPLCPAKPR